VKASLKFVSDDLGDNIAIKIYQRIPKSRMPLGHDQRGGSHPGHVVIPFVGNVAADAIGQGRNCLMVGCREMFWHRRTQPLAAGNLDGGR